MSATEPSRDRSDTDADHGLPRLPDKVSDSFAHMTSDSPSSYLIESQIEMLGRLGNGRSRRQRIMGKTVAWIMLAPFLFALAYLLVTLIGSLISL